MFSWMVSYNVRSFDFQSSPWIEYSNRLTFEFIGPAICIQIAYLETQLLLLELPKKIIAVKNL